MAIPSKAFGIDHNGRILVTLAADDKVESKQLSVGTTAVELKSDGAFTDRKKLFVRNLSATVVYIGDSSVTSSDGFPLYQYDELELDANRVCALHGITASSSAQVCVLEVQ